MLDGNDLRLTVVRVGFGIQVDSMPDATSSSSKDDIMEERTGRKEDRRDLFPPPSDISRDIFSKLGRSSRA